MLNIVSFSGGKDSTAMLLKLLENGYDIDYIIMGDTRKEFPQMYNHINKVNKYIENEYNKNIIIVKNENDTFETLIEKYGWPNFMFRYCTGSLKLDIIKREIKRININNEIVNQYIGINNQEIKRKDKLIKKETRNKKYTFPLIDIFNMSGDDNLKYCYDKGFDWEGLYEQFDRVSCYCCPLQRLNELKNIYNNYPELWLDIKKLDNIGGNIRTFRKDYTIKELEIKFDNE